MLLCAFAISITSSSEVISNTVVPGTGLNLVNLVKSRETIHLKQHSYASYQNVNTLILRDHLQLRLKSLLTVDRHYSCHTG